MFLTLEESFKWAATKDAQRRAALFEEMKRIEEEVHYKVFSDATYMKALGLNEVGIMAAPNHPMWPLADRLFGSYLMADLMKGETDAPI